MGSIDYSFDDNHKKSLEKISIPIKHLYRFINSIEQSFFTDDELENIYFKTIIKDFQISKIENVKTKKNLAESKVIFNEYHEQKIFFDENRFFCFRKNGLLYSTTFKNYTLIINKCISFIDNLDQE
jgi:hypothetical protein